ncbi:ABC transporter ATP-binding protein [Lachnoclostridium sp. An118]|uniref:ABC transporter ATP-binding protein n=1 Tax=Lachnoclostridium sp. An118 TaxID=1965547 RepID=UPI000B36945B|nr:ABC transporter ATP-binding protein [Lachnoclostridium sp. An118]OUQ48405.1 multidrug ABC transporter ATP-binding protein [Lachnoclostridium sp. An118]
MLKILRKFFDFCGGENRRKFYLSIFFGVLMALFEALKIPAIVLMLDAVIRGNVTVAVIWQCLGICLVSIIGGFIVKYFNTIIQCEAGYGTAAGKRIEIAEHLRYLPMGYFNNNSMGYITSVTTNTMENLGDVATRVVMLTTQGVLTTLIIAVMLLFYDWRIGLVVLAGLLLFFLANSRMQRKSEKVSPRKIAADSGLVEKLLEYIQGIMEVRAYNMTSAQSRKLDAAISENEDCNFTLEKTFIPYMCAQNFVTKMTGVAMTLLSIWFYLEGTMDLIVCISMMICSFIVYSSLDSAGNYSALLRTVDVSVDKAREILDLQPMDTEGRDLKPKDHDIDVEDIAFSYDKRRVIDGITVHIPERTTTAIVGPSGGGKTTLCHLISRFWDVDQGQVRLGGVDVRDYSMDSLMQNFSFVFQNVYLFQDTVANNIRFGQEEAPMEKVVEAAKKACCHDFIMALPEGYDTVIGEGGASLSGGEKQRLSVARAMMKDAPVIILDEATANVDPENEKELVEAIEALTKEKTILMIAHRLKTVRHADQILVVDKGKLVQRGRHEELMQEEGIYRRFVNARETAAGWKL